MAGASEELNFMNPASFFDIYPNLTIRLPHKSAQPRRYVIFATWLLTRQVNRPNVITT